MQIHLLGYSEATISRILDALSVSGYSADVPIILNMSVPESIPFCPPGMNTTKLQWENWKFDRLRQKCFLGVMNPEARRNLFEFFRLNAGIEQADYCNIIHPQAVVASTAVLANGVMIEPSSVVASFARLGFGVYVNRGCTVGHHSTLGDYMMMGPGVHVAGHCDIGTGVKIGIGTVVFDHVSIGEHTIIGGGSVVTKDLPAGVVAFGNPCKVIKTIQSNEA